MFIEVHDPATTTEVLIPEARQHQRRRYFRLAIVAALSALLVAALVTSAVVLFPGPAASDKSRAASVPAVGATRMGPVYFRPVLCLAPPFSAAASSSSATSSLTCNTASELKTTNLNVEPQNGAAGFSSNNVPPDSALAGVPSTKPWAEKANSTVLLPGISGTNAPFGPSGERFVLGPAEMSSASIGSAVAYRNRTGAWIVGYTMRGPKGAVLWDKVAQENFHQLLGVDLHGVVVSLPIIEPTQSSFTSFAGRGEISGTLTKAEAKALARALNNPH